MKPSKSTRLSERGLREVSNAIPVLEIMRKAQCGYFGSQCDCKYGYDGVVNGEQTGCPELRVAIYALKDYESMVERTFELEAQIDKEVEARIKEKLNQILKDL